MQAKGPQAIGKIVNLVVKELEDKKRENIVEIWRKTVGKKISSHTKPVGIKRGCLLINVDKATWLYELMLCRRLILTRLKKRLKDYSIEDLRFRIGEL